MEFIQGFLKFTLCEGFRSLNFKNIMQENLPTVNQLNDQI